MFKFFIIEFLNTKLTEFLFKSSLFYLKKPLKLIKAHYENL